jgi:hypothetical protein
VSAAFEHSQQAEATPHSVIPGRTAARAPQAALAFGAFVTIEWSGGLVWLVVRLLLAVI